MPDAKPKKTANDWLRDMRMSASVNKTTLGVESERVTPDVMLAASGKLLKINRREAESDPKDSLQFQRIYGPTDYFAEHILRDAGRLGRQLLWKATNKGNLDFMQPGSLDQHVSDVFNSSKLTNMVDASSPFESVEASYKVTRIGEGGVGSTDSAPLEMRLVQPSFLGYVDPIRSVESWKVGLDAYIAKNVMKGSDGKLYQTFINAHTGRPELVDSEKAARSVVTTPDMMKAKTNHIYAMGGKTGIRIVKKSDVDYYLPNMDDAFTNAANMVPGFSGVKEMRLLMGCLHPQTNVLCVNKNKEVSIIPASDLNTTVAEILPGATDKGTARNYHVRTTVAKLPGGKCWFRKVVLRSGRTLITSKDHRWSVVRDGETVLVEAERLKKGDRVLRSMFKDLPNRRMFINKQLVTRDVAVLLGYACRTLEYSENKANITFSTKHRERLEKAIDKLQLREFVHFYNSTNFRHRLNFSQCWFTDWLKTNIGYTDADRRVPSEVLSADLPTVLCFMDAYTADETQIATDAIECVWILNIPNMQVRDSLAFLLARMGTDTYYRDSYQGDGEYQLALKLVDKYAAYGDCVLDEVKTVLRAPDAPYMVDIDINDNLYATANGIITHNSKYPQQAISLQHREAPYVRNLDSVSGKDMASKIGSYLGARFAKKPGMVTAVRKDRIDMLYDDGTKGSVDLYENFPMNAKGFISNTPQVKAGQHINKGGLLASSNYTDDKGAAALGLNLRTGWISWKGGTYEDAIVLSESAAKKLTSDTMYSNDLDLDKTITLGKRNYLSWKPSEYTKDQLAILDDDGIVKPGSIVRKGDPLVLAVRRTEPSPGTMGKRLLTDLSQTWDHDHPGVITDIVRTRSGVRVLAKVTAPAEVGDKLSNGFGNKGVVSAIYSDDQMPQDKDGKPLEILMSPLGLVSRCYDERTEFLTDHGWRYGKDVLDTDLLACYDPQIDRNAWLLQAEPMHKAPYKGRMYGAHNNELDFLVTPHHKVRIWTDTESRECLVEDVYRTDVLFPDGEGGRLKCMVDNWYMMEDYVGMVYCPTVPTGYVVTRRNGKVVCMGNTNPAQLVETLLGKIAHKTGKPITIPAFYEGNIHDYVMDQLKQNRLHAEDDFFDPETGKRLPDVVNGYSYIYKLKHLAESKEDARGVDNYSNDETPGDSAKRFGTLEVGALVSHNAFDTLLDNKLIRGQSNADFWRNVRTGGIPTIPGEPLVQKKFFAYLQGSGINVRKTQKGVSVFALSNKDVDELAGPRELKSRDTYEAKTFRPIAGGLFGQDTFGPNGDKWAYIQLDEPVPNPIMAEPLAKLLRMSDKDFVACATGQKEVNGIKGPVQLQKILSETNLESEAKTAMSEFKTAPASKKDAALKRYVAIENMRRNGVQPSEYMLTRIPVLPPVFRPITSHNGLTMVADANYLYAQLLDARDDMREAKSLPQEYQDKARMNLYRTWNELTGLYDPEDIKLRNKNVGGLLQWALGKGSPKFSAFQRKVLGSTVDTVGRGTVIPDSRLMLDEVGLPVGMAMDMMSPFVERKLVNAGYSPVDAMKMVKKRDQRAMAMLDEVIKTHPVLLNRAPTLHKYSILAFKPKLVSGHAIHTHPAVCPGLAMDYDGDAVNIHVPVSYNAQQEALNKMLPSKTLIGPANRKIMNKPEKEFLQGLYIATRMGEAPNGRAQIFRTYEEARAAYKQGLIDVDTPIQILETKK